jgi:hypothetical protein
MKSVMVTEVVMTISMTVTGFSCVRHELNQHQCNKQTGNPSRFYYRNHV